MKEHIKRAAIGLAIIGAPVAAMIATAAIAVYVHPFAALAFAVALLSYGIGYAVRA